MSHYGNSNFVINVEMFLLVYQSWPPFKESTNFFFSKFRDWQELLLFSVPFQEHDGFPGSLVSVVCSAKQASLVGLDELEETSDHVVVVVVANHQALGAARVPLAVFSHSLELKQGCNMKGPLLHEALQGQQWVVSVQLARDCGDS